VIIVTSTSTTRAGESRRANASGPSGPSGQSDVGAPDVSSAERTRRTAELLRRAATECDETRRALQDEAIVLNLPVARALAARYRNRGQPQEDLEQVACLALTRAVRTFDPDRAEDLLVLAVPSILGELKRHFRDTSWAVRPPRRLQELRAELAEAEERLTQELGRAPRPVDLAEDVGVDVEDVHEALVAGGGSATDPIDVAPHPGATPLVEQLPVDDPGFDRSEAVVVLSPACRRLRPRDRAILRMRFYEQRTQQQIADAYGISQVQVSRLLQRILAELRRSVTRGSRRPGRSGDKPAA
jgi:RNA polymerase sigma-B factor